MKNKECVVLAGGLGTRLQSMVTDVPKCMALINNIPFLKYLLDYLDKQGFEKTILSLGYKSETVIEWLNDCKYNMNIDYVIEDKPLGTGGAISYAATMISESDFFVFNGDTYFDIDTDKLLSFHQEHNYDISLALKEMKDFNRYGTVDLNGNRVVNFLEKKQLSEGLINGGIYILNKKVLEITNQVSYSFEKEVLEKKVNELAMFGCVFDSYFIDIGVPEDYMKMNFDFSKRG